MERRRPTETFTNRLERFHQGDLTRFAAALAGILRAFAPLVAASGREAVFWTAPALYTLYYAACLQIRVCHSGYGVFTQGCADIFALNASKRIYFVSKAEVAAWPGIGWLARATGTVFIKRDRNKAREQIDVFKDRLAAGHKLLFFPEGTSTDGQLVLAFKPTLFAAFFDPVLIDRMRVQPVTVRYEAPQGADPRFYGWWGDMDFGPHLLATLAAPRQGRVTVIYHQPVKLTDFADRKHLALALETTVRSGLAHRSDQ